MLGDAFTMWHRFATATTEQPHQRSMDNIVCMHHCVFALLVFESHVIVMLMLPHHHICASRGAWDTMGLSAAPLPGSIMACCT
jgi:hypothetical protein